MQLNPYINFDGQCEAAFKFYERCLGGKIENMMTWGESPMAEHTPQEWHGKIIHTRLNTGSSVLMGSDAPPGRYEAMKGCHVTLVIDNPAEAERVFGALAEGGTEGMPLQETFWASRFGMLVDRYGIAWMINCERPAA